MQQNGLVGKRKRQAAGLRALAAALERVTRATFRRRGFAEAGVLSQWPAIVGAELAARSCPEKLAFRPGEGKGGTLHVRVTSGFATELQHLEPLVLERINAYFGFPAVARLAMTQGPLPETAHAHPAPARALDAAEEAAIAESVGGTADSGLATALRDLGRRVAASTRAREEGDNRGAAASRDSGSGHACRAPEDCS